jgi:2-dehydropantoate 2-reductase
MRVAIFGAGAIGGYLAAKLAAAGKVEVTVIARGAQLTAIQADGITLLENGASATHRVAAVSASDSATLGPQDTVLLTLKANGVAAALPALAPLLGPDTSVVTMQNGIPWWYFYRHGGAREGIVLSTVDPGGAIARAIGPERAIGAVVYPAVEVESPGVIRHVEGKRLSLGEPSGEKTARVAAIAGALIAAGLQARVRSDIRDEIWLKLWGNLSFNPISALTGATLAAIVADEGTRAVARAMMVEAEAVGRALGVHFPLDVDRRLAGGGAVGEHKTSMLQDLERDRPMEIEPVVGAVAELGRLTAIPTPTVDTVLALVRRLAIERGLG